MALGVGVQGPMTSS